MLDLRYVTQNLPEVTKGLARRGPGINLTEIERLSKQRLELIGSTESARAEQKRESPRLGRLLKEDPPAAEALRTRLKALGDGVKAGEQELTVIEEKLTTLLMDVPNIPHASVPDGKSADDNQVVRYGPAPKPELPFTAKPHWELGESLGILDWERAAKVSGARFTFYFGAAARLERALVSFMLDIHTSRGYREVLPPFLVNRASMTGTGQLPKFEQLEISRYVFCPGSHTSRSYVFAELKPMSPAHSSITR